MTHIVYVIHPIRVRAVYECVRTAEYANERELIRCERRPKTENRKSWREKWSRVKVNINYSALNVNEYAFIVAR